ncbi:MAG: BON domain-containing protein [Methylococcaceae bacterium]
MISKSGLIIRLLLVAMFSLAMVSCAGNRTSESTGEYLDDTVISSKVRTAILADAGLKVFQISVETFKGVVQLSGFVDSQTTINKAVEITRKVKGVKTVNNSLIAK